MAIIRTEINGDLTALKTALESLGFFASVTLDSESTPTTVTCKDADNHTLLTYNITGSGTRTATWSVYKNATTHVDWDTSAATPAGQPKNFYKVGSNGAVIQSNSNNFMLLIGKTNTEAIGVAMQNSTATAIVGCWGDDADLTTQLTACANSSPMTGNHVLFVQIPMHGAYNTPTWMTKAFFLPMAQNNMRNVMQEVSGDAGVYLTNGYFAMIDDAGGAA